MRTCCIVYILEVSSVSRNLDGRGNKKREGNRTDHREIKGILCQRVKSVAGYHNIVVT